MEKRDFYDILGAAREAAGDEIKKAYARRRASCTRIATAANRI